MKEIIKIIVLVAVLILPSCASQTTSQVHEPEGQVSMDLFYSQLNPYGVWINYPGYGQVWVPDVGYGFTPYATSGQWVYTSWGWTWESYYRWGWAPFHYGRWFNDPMYGWVWVPDTVWGPAWVVWSTGGGYCGWAPLAPRVSMSVAVSGRYTIPREHWVFVREDDLANRRITRYQIEKSRNSELLNNAMLVRETRVHRQRTYSPGPRNRTAQKSMDESLKYNGDRGNDRTLEQRNKYNDTRRNDRLNDEQSSDNSRKLFNRERPSENSNARERNSQKQSKERRDVRPERPGQRPTNQYESPRKNQPYPGRQGRESSTDRRQSRGRDKNGS